MCTRFDATDGTTWDDQILSWFENGNGKAINITISFSELERSLLCSVPTQHPNFQVTEWLGLKGEKFQRAQSLFFSDVFIGVAFVGS